VTRGPGRRAHDRGALARSAARALDGVTTGDWHRAVKVVGIKELKARLSEHVRLAKGGEIILVTERDEVVAELRRARREAPRVADRLEDTLEALAATGEITRAARPKGAWTWRTPGLGLPPGTVDAVLDELRRDRA
jgi:antitoxin (DNA-binding transcriptional repressor) of toxin-antitoxin stability system